MSQLDMLVLVLLLAAIHTFVLAWGRMVAYLNRRGLSSAARSVTDQVSAVDLVAQHDS
jgi:hypothetical protein